MDRGEAEVIALGLEQRARLVLIDELIGRKVAESLGLQITGSVGILIKAKQAGEITAVKPLLEEMVARGMYYSRRFMEAVLRQVHRIDPAALHQGSEAMTGRAGDHRAACFVPGSLRPSAALCGEPRKTSGPATVAFGSSPGPAW